MAAKKYEQNSWHQMCCTYLHPAYFYSSSSFGEVMLSASSFRIFFQSYFLLHSRILWFSEMVSKRHFKTIIFWRKFLKLPSYCFFLVLFYFILCYFILFYFTAARDIILFNFSKWDKTFNLTLGQRQKTLGSVKT